MSTSSIAMRVALAALIPFLAGCSDGAPQPTSGTLSADPGAPSPASPLPTETTSMVAREQGEDPTLAEETGPAETTHVKEAATEERQPDPFPGQPGWVREELDNKLRLAQFRLPRAAHDTQDAALVVFSFGGPAGDVESNIARWTQMFEQTAGSDPAVAAEPSERDGMTFHTVDVSGHFVAPATPGAAGAADKPDWRLIGTVIEVGARTYYVKLTGPRATVEHWKTSYAAFLDQVDPAR